MKKMILKNIFLLILVFILNCDVLVKKNEGEFDKNHNDDYYYISYKETTDFMSLVNKFVLSVDRKYLYTFYDDVGGSNIYVWDVDNVNGHIYNERQLSSTGTDRYLAISPDNKFLYTADGSTFVYVYERKNNGDINIIQQLSPGFPEAVINNIIISPNNKFIYFLCGNYIAWLERNIENGKLSNMHSIFPNVVFNKVIFSPDFRHLYVFSEGSGNLQWYEINNDSGYLKYKGSLGLGANTSELTLSQDGRFMYISNGSIINCYKRNYSNGSLSYINFVSLSGTIYSMIISPDKDFLYTVTSGNMIEWFSINSDSGELSNHNNYNLNLDLPNCINFSAQGDFIFVLNFNSTNFTIYNVNKD